MRVLLATLLLAFTGTLYAQTGLGIAFYTTGTDVGFGIRTSKNTKWILDARVSKTNFYANRSASGMTNELSAVCRVVKLEKIFFHVGAGLRSEWRFEQKNKFGVVVPCGVEAFPFPFQNAGLFFEAAPFFTHNFADDYYGGIRTVAGFVFYFPVKEKQVTN